MMIVYLVCEDYVLQDLCVFVIKTDCGGVHFSSTTTDLHTPIEVVIGRSK